MVGFQWPRVCLFANCVLAWGLKSVSFAMELFSILREGREANLTAIRFTQTRGSATSLYKLGEQLSKQLEKTFLYKNAEEVKQITRLIQTGTLNSFPLRR
jgi:hypothetical protein